MQRVSSNVLARRVKIAVQYPTTVVERFLLVVTIVLLPLETYFPTIAGFTISYILFIIIACYVVLNRPYLVTKAWLHPLFLSAYLMLILILLIELSNPYSNIRDIFRFGQIIIAAMFVALLCRDRPALRSAIYGYLIAGLWMSILLFMTSYGAISMATATDFREASHLRSEIFSENTLEANLNFMAFVAAQGTVVALALALKATSPYRRNLFLVISLLCFVAAFLPLSRSGVAIVIATSVIVMLAYGIKRVRTLMLAATFGIVMLTWVPDAVFSRMTFSTQADDGKMEARARIYSTAIKTISEHGLTGVGLGNYYLSWGMSSDFVKLYKQGPAVLGPHNWYFAVTIYWGIGGLLALSLVVYQAYRCLPKCCGADSLSLCLLGIAVSLFLYSLVTHVLVNKVFSLGFGLLVGARLWIWPQGIVRAASQGLLSPLYSTLRYRS
jgi:O-Antigen ligase